MKSLVPSAMCLLALLAGLAVPAHAQTATRVKDIQGDDYLWHSGTYAVTLAAAGDQAFFISGHTTNKVAVVNADGTESTILLDLCPGDDCFTDPPWLVGSLGRLVLFSVQTGKTNLLFRSDGTREGTYPLGVAGVDTRQLAVAGGLAYFLRFPAGAPVEIWVSDGSVAGTRRIPWAPADVAGPSPTLTAVGQRVFFLDGRDLWTSDGTAEGAVLLRSFAANDSPGGLVGGTHRLYFSTSLAGGGGGRKIWESDGTPQGTLPVPGLPTVPDRIPQLGRVGDHLYLAITDPDHGQELWTSDGTAAGSRRVSDFPNPAPPGDLIGIPLVAELGGRQVFATQGGLWAASSGAGGAGALSPARARRPGPDLGPPTSGPPRHLPRQGCERPRDLVDGRHPSRHGAACRRLCQPLQRQNLGD